MAVPNRLPDLGTNVDECKVLSWRVQEGQQVKRGEVLAEIETDKAVAELESTAEGVLLCQMAKASDSARTGEGGRQHGHNMDEQLRRVRENRSSASRRRPWPWLNCLGDDV